MNDNPLQALMDGMSARWQADRAATSQLTLGELIAKLETLDPNAAVLGMGQIHSYRGYYCDLAFGSGYRGGPLGRPQPVAKLLELARGAMGKVFQGYKGGDYTMGESTPIWIADYGDAPGKRLMDLTWNEYAYFPVTEKEHDDI